MNDEWAVLVATSHICTYQVHIVRVQLALNARYPNFAILAKAIDSMASGQLKQTMMLLFYCSLPVASVPYDRVASRRPCVDALQSQKFTQDISSKYDQSQDQVRGWSNHVNSALRITTNKLQLNSEIHHQLDVSVFPSPLKLNALGHVFYKSNPPFIPRGQSIFDGSVTLQSYA